MHNAQRPYRALLVCLAVAASFLTIGAGSAFALAWGPAGGGAVLQGSLTLTGNGQTVTCSSFSQTGTLYTNLYLTGGAPPSLCNNGTQFSMVSWANPGGSAGAYTYTNTVNQMNLNVSPWGSYMTKPWTVPYYNASRGYSSRIVLSNTLLGHLPSNGELRATGTLTFKTPTGGNITIN